MRVRSTESDQHSFTEHAFGFRDPYPTQYTNYGYFTWSVKPEVSCITDAPGKRWSEFRGRRFTLMKPCEQRRVTIDAPSTVHHRCPCGAYAPNPPWLVCHSGYRLLNNFVTQSNANTFVDDLLQTFTQPDANLYCADWMEVRPTAGTRANAAVFLWELHDLKRMLEVLPSKYDFGNWYSLTKYVNSQHLNYNFGWRPFVADLQKFGNVYMSWSTRVKRFISEQNRLLKRHRRHGNVLIPLKGTKWSNFDWKIVIDGQYEATSVATFDFVYTLPAYTTTEFQIRLFLDAVGLKASWANLWAIVPWSFVVDWFYDVSDLLESTEDDWIIPVVHFLQGCYSTKFSGSFALTGMSNRGWDWKVPVMNVSFTNYSRTLRGFPNNCSGALESLSADKIRLLGSLAFGRL